MSNNTSRSINIYIETGNAERAYDKLITKEKELKQELEKATNPKQVEKLNKELAGLQEPIARAAKKLSGELAPSFKDLDKTVTSLRNQLKNMSTGDANYDKVLKQYRDANDLLQQQKRELQSMPKPDTSSGMFSGAFWGNLAAKAVEFGKQQIQQALQWALELEGVQRAYDRLNNPQLLDQLRTATKGTVSDLELMKKAVQANNFQIPLEQLGTLLEFAQRRAQDTGESVDYLVNSIVTGIARKSPMILDNLGISASRLSEDFKKTGDFAKAVFGIVQQELEKMGPAMETNADKVNRLKASWQNFWTEVGAGAVSIADNVIEAFRSTYDMGGIIADRANQEIAKKNQAAYEFEVHMLDDYKKSFATADKAGRDKIIAQVKGEISTTQQLQEEATRNDEQALMNRHARALELWSKFLKDLQDTPLTGTDTIAGIELEKSALEDMLKTLNTKSEKFAQTQQRIKELQKMMDDATGKTAEDAARKAEQAAKEAESRRKQEYKKIIEEKKRLAEELKRISVSLMPDEIGKEMAALNDRYQQLRRLAHNDKSLLLQAEETYQKEKQALIDKYAQKTIANSKQQAADELKQVEQRIQRIKELTTVHFPESVISLGRSLDADQLAEDELNVIKSRGKDRLEFQVKQLHDERDIELKNTNLTQQQKALIIEQYRQKEEELEQEHWQNMANQIIDWAGQMLSVFDTISQARTASENAELERDRKINDRKKANLESRFKSGHLTQLEFDRQSAELEKKQEAREKEMQLRQFKRTQRMQIAQAFMGGASAVVSTLAAKPGALDILTLAAFRAINIGLVAAATATQIAAIASQEPPSMARGGMLYGPSHAEGGIPAVNRHGVQIAEVEGGESITNKHTMADKNKYELSGTPSQIISRLNALHGGVHWDSGATLRPLWSVQAPPAMNFSAINSSINTVRRFAAGGVIDANTSSTSSANDATMQHMVVVLNNMQVAIINLQESNERLQLALSQPIKAYTVITEQEAQQKRIDNIRNDAAWK